MVVNIMKAYSVRKVQRSLIETLRRGLLFPVGLLILCLLLSFAVGIWAYVNQQQLGSQRVAIQNSTNSILSSMIDQETGIRGYISTDDANFLTPLTTGRPQYLLSLQQLKNETQGSAFTSTRPAIARVESNAATWYNNYAEVQINNIKNGKIATARSVQSNASGKALFDAFRTSVSQLQSAIDHDLADLQTQTTILDLTSLGIVALLSLFALVLLWRAMVKLMGETQEQLDVLQDVTEQLGTGDFTSRAGDLSYRELDRLGQTLNTMASALQEQRNALLERDILEQVLQLNSVLTRSIELDSLSQDFLRSTLSLLQLHLGSLYFYNAKEQVLHLVVSQGLDSQQMQKSFRLGEGLVGQVADTREPLYLNAQQSTPTSNEEIFSVKTSLGSVLPASLYHLPLVSGKTLLGVLVVGSIYPMNENARNVLDVVASNLTSVLGNTQAYQRIQEQAEELERRNREQANINAVLRHQRDDLTVLNAALEEANKARSQFLSTMSHELRTPLTSIIGFSQILLRPSEAAKLSSRQRGNIERILKNGQHLLSLINDVLDLAKIEAGRMDVHYEQVQLRELLSTVVEETQSIAIERRLALRWNVENDVEAIETDPVRLRQILLNLISNALKFTEKGEVTVTARHVAPSSVAEAMRDETGRILSVEQVAISVQDTGIGISQEVQEHIFEAFYQVDGSNTRKYGGTGLGLSIVHQLATLLGGKIELQSEEGRGSTFTLFLPVKRLSQAIERRDVRLNSGALLRENRAVQMQKMLQDARVDVLEGEEDEQGQRIVLAIDDNPDVLQLINSVLESSSYTVIGIDDPTKAVEMAQTLQPSVVTLDVMMPEMNGWQVLHQIRSNPATSNIPVIILTVLEDRSAAHVLGADDYLVKPVERESLLNTLNQVAVQSLQKASIETVPATTAAQSKTDVASELIAFKDQPPVRETLERVLAQTGLSVKVVSEEREIVETMKQGRPDVILLRPVPQRRRDTIRLNKEAQEQQEEEQSLEQQGNKE